MPDETNLGTSSVRSIHANIQCGNCGDVFTIALDEGSDQKAFDLAVDTCRFGATVEQIKVHGKIEQQSGFTAVHPNLGMVCAGCNQKLEDHAERIAKDTNEDYDQMSEDEQDNLVVQFKNEITEPV